MIRLTPTRPKIIVGAVPDPSLPWAISYAGVLMLADLEKLTFEPYVCPAGVPTNGWGETDGVTMDMKPWTKAIADQRFVESVAERAGVIKRLVTVPLNPNQLAALVILVYNIGEGNFTTSTVRRALNKGDYESAARAFGLFNQAENPKTGKKEVMPGLTARRAHEKALFLTPVPEDGPSASPQVVAAESTPAKSPINIGGAVSVGSGALGLLTTVGDQADKAKAAVDQVTGATTTVVQATTGIRGVLAEFDVTPVEVFGGLSLIAGVVVMWYRTKQRQGGWA